MNSVLLVVTDLGVKEICFYKRWLMSVLGVSITGGTSSFMVLNKSVIFLLLSFLTSSDNLSSSLTDLDGLAT